jgi:hypothetical protein
MAVSSVQELQCEKCWANNYRIAGKSFCILPACFYERKPSKKEGEADGGKKEVDRKAKEIL